MSRPLPPPPRRIESPGPLVHAWRRADIGWGPGMGLAILTVPGFAVFLVVGLSYALSSIVQAQLITIALVVLVFAVVWFDVVGACRRMRRDRRLLRHGEATTLPVVEIRPGGIVGRPILMVEHNVRRGFLAASLRESDFEVGDEVPVVVGSGPEGQPHIVVPDALGAELAPAQGPSVEAEHAPTPERTPKQRQAVFERTSDDEALFALDDTDAPLVDQLEAEVAELHPGQLELEDRTFVWNADGVRVHGVDGEKRKLQSGSIQLSRSTDDDGELLYAELREQGTGERVTLEASVPDDVDTTGIPTLAEPGRRVDFLALASLCRALLVHGWTLARFLPEAAREARPTPERDGIGDVDRAADEVSPSTTAAAADDDLEDADEPPGAVDEETAADEAPSKAREGPGDAAAARVSHRPLRVKLIAHSATTVGVGVLSVALLGELARLAVGFGVLMLLIGGAFWIARLRMTERRPGDVVEVAPPQPTEDDPFRLGRLVSVGYGVGGGVAATWGMVALYVGAESIWPIVAGLAVWCVAIGTRRAWRSENGDERPLLNAIPVMVSWVGPGALAADMTGREMWAHSGPVSDEIWEARLVFVAIFALLPVLRWLGRGAFWRHLFDAPLGTVFITYLVFAAGATLGILLQVVPGLLAAIHPLAAGLVGALAGALYGRVVALVAGISGEDHTRIVGRT